MNIKHLILTLVLASGMTPVSALAQDPQRQIEEALERAGEARIPTSMLESKVAEGRAKGLPMDRIAQAVERRLEGLSVAQQALVDVPDVGPGELDLSADALQSGVSEAVLVQLAETAPRERRAAAIATLTYLVAADIAPEQALAEVQDALARGPEALQNLPAQVEAPGPAEIPVSVPVPGGAPEVGAPTGTPQPSTLPGGPPGE